MMIRYLPAGKDWRTAVFSEQLGAITANHGSLTFSEKVTVPLVLQAVAAKLEAEGKLDVANELRLFAEKA